MYITDTDLLRKIASIADSVARQTHNEIVFREYAALPHYGGNIMLRFSLNAKSCTPEALRRYEEILYAAAGDDFLVDLSGEIYQKLGLESDLLNEKLYELFSRCSNEPIVDSAHKEQVLNDALSLQKLAGVSRFARVWEIHPGSPTVLLIFGKQNGLFKKTNLPDGTPLVVYEVREEDCEGLMRAAFFAKRSRATLPGLLL